MRGALAALASRSSVIPRLHFLGSLFPLWKRQQDR
jgi:hypothetical protein